MLPLLNFPSYEFHNPNHFASYMPNIQRYFKNKQLCDVTLRVHDKTIEAHQIILMARVPYFMSLLGSGNKEVVLNNLEFDILEIVMNYVYTGTLPIEEQTVAGLMEATTFLEIATAAEACRKFFVGYINDENILQVRKEVAVKPFKEALSLCDNYINQKFQRLIKDRIEDFLELEVEDFVGIIKRNELTVEREEIVYEAALKWLKHNKAEKEKFKEQVLENIRFPFMTLEYLINFVEEESLIKSSEKLVQLVKEAKKHLLSKKTEETNDVNVNGIKPRSYAELYVIGQCGKNSDIEHCIEIYNPVTEKWRYCDAKFKERCTFGVATLDSKIYVIGGTDGNYMASLDIYDTKTNEWAKGPDMSRAKACLACCVLNERIYVCGGLNPKKILKLVEYYCPNANAWKTVKSMKHARENHKLLAFNGYLYAIGGRSNRTLATVERYDPDSDSWQEKSPMLHKRSGHGAAVLNGKIYVCGGHDQNNCLNSVEVYDPLTNEWEEVKPLNIARSNVNLYTYKNKLWAIGGFDGKDRLTSIEVYDPLKNEWSAGPELLSAKSHGGVGTIGMKVPEN